MTADEVRAALATLGETQRGFARAHQIDERTVRRWAKVGTDGVGAALLRTLLAARRPETQKPPPG